MQARLDHLVVAAPSLAEGVAWAEATLGVTPAPGGAHALMGTHNRLLALGGWPQAYLEIIAVDPDAPPPRRRRWFGLDTPPAAPTLLHFVARTTNLDMDRWGLVAAGFDPGTTLEASRGDLRWRITVPDDGRLRLGGALPTLIEWAGRHPADTLGAPALVLESLRVRGLPQTAAGVLRLAQVERDAAPGPALEARLATPRGTVTLRSPFTAPP